MGLEGELVPPALDLERFRLTRNLNHRTGAVCIGRMAYGKGLELLAEYPEPVDVYSSVPVNSERNARYKGAAADVPAMLAQYERFIFLPTALGAFRPRRGRGMGGGLRPGRQQECRRCLLDRGKTAARWTLPPRISGE